MKITLENFKCWTNHTFDLGEKGQTLITACSGFGKSSLFSSIIFAITGEGKKIVQYNKKKCKVVLEYKDLVITRTKNPSSLRVKDKDGVEWKDDAGQDIIDKIFSCVFEKVGILGQKSENSFITMSATNKLSFLERFAFEGVDLKDVKNNIKSTIVERQNELLKITTEKDTIERIINDKNGSDTLKKMRKPVGFSQDKFEKMSDEYDTMHKEMERLETEMEENKSKEIRLQSLQSLQDTFEKEITNLKNDLTKINVLSETDNERLTSELDAIEQYIEYQELQSEYDDELKEFERDTRDKLEGLQSQLQSDDELQSLQSSLQEYKLEKNRLQKYETIENKITELKRKYCKDKHLDIAKSIASHTIRHITCIKCETKMVSYEDGRCEESDVQHDDNENHIDYNVLSELKNTLEELNNQEYIINQYSNELQTIGDCKSGYSLKELQKMIDTAQQCIEEQRVLRDKVKELSETQHPYSLRKKAKILTSKKSAISIESFKEGRDEELVEILNNDTDNNEKKRGIEKEIAKNETHLRKIMNEMHEMGGLEEITSSVKTIQSLRKNIAKLSKKIEEWRMYKLYKDDISDFERMKERLSDILKEEVVVVKRLNAIKNFKERVSQAQSISLSQIINTINEYAEIYMSEFFEENITCYLKSWKDTNNGKNTKPQIDLDIHYKGNDMEFGSLSGGEQDRVVLAYTLSLAELFKLPFLMCDESISSLDKESTERILSSIKRYYKGEQVLFIAHQVITGTFENVIDLVDIKQNKKNV